MSEVVRFETVVDLDGDGSRHGSGGAPGVAFLPTTYAVLDDGRRLAVVEGRGWSEFLHGIPPGEVGDPWVHQAAGDIAATALVVVGPDEPVGDETDADMDRWYWRSIADDLAALGVPADPDALQALPHAAVLTDAVQAKLSRPSPEPRSPAT